MNKLTALYSKLFLYLFSSKSKSSFITSSSSSYHDFYVSLFECITCSSSLSMEVIMLFVIVNIDFLKLFIMSYIYGLNLVRYCSTDSVLILSMLLLFSI